jgi:hypothetical protein
MTALEARSGPGINAKFARLGSEAGQAKVRGILYRVPWFCKKTTYPRNQGFVANPRHAGGIPPAASLIALRGESWPPPAPTRTRTPS